MKTILQYRIACGNIYPAKQNIHEKEVIIVNAQFKKGALELCVLSQLKNADRYGYQLTDAVSQEMAIAPGTLYLVLKRLKEEALVETYLVESDEGPARKYYHLTEKGKDVLKIKEKEWHEYSTAVNRVLNGGLSFATR